MIKFFGRVKNVKESFRKKVSKKVRKVVGKLLWYVENVRNLSQVNKGEKGLVLKL